MFFFGGFYFNRKSSVITGKYSNKHGVRDAYSCLAGTTIATILKEESYCAAGFVGNELLAKRHGFAQEFDFFSETSKDTSRFEVKYSNSGNDKIIYEGSYWVKEFFDWLKNNYQQKFIICGYLYETHEAFGDLLVKRGLIKEEELSEFDYYDVKIETADEKLVGRLSLIGKLKELSIYDNTAVALMSDQGTNLGEHLAKDIPWRKRGTCYPQHTTMYGHDLHVAMMIKWKDLPKDNVIQGIVRSIDLILTLLEHIDISTQIYDFDRQSWLPLLKQDQGRNEIYFEDLFGPRGLGALQFLCIPEYNINS